MERKLELADIAMYLPYGLNYKDEDGKIKTCEGCAIEPKGLRYTDDYGMARWSFLRYCKPILRPMSDLTKPMTHPDVNGGEEFVPLIEVAKLFHYDRVWELSSNGCVVSFSNVGSKRRTDTGFYLYWGLLVANPNGFVNSFGESYGNSGNECSFNPLVLQFLAMLHFDYNSLLDQCLAIDINTTTL